jgi:hypothetical protein
MNRVVTFLQCARSALAAVNRTGPRLAGKKAQAGHSLLGLLLVLAFISLFALACLVPSARADARYFNCTNCLSSNNVVFGYPTNVVTTNGVGQGTGGALSLANVNSAAFFFQGFVLTNGLGSDTSLHVWLVRSWAGNPPGVQYGSNALTTCVGTSLLYTDWETWSNSSALALTIPVNYTKTNWITWGTNLDNNWLGGANWLGIACISNAATFSFMTNVQMGVNEKIIPIRYP